MLKKKMSLNIKIWLFLSAITTLLFVVYSLLFPFLVREIIHEPNPKPKYSISSPNHMEKILLLDDGTIISNSVNHLIPQNIVDESIKKAVVQQALSQNYLFDDGQNQYAYEIQKFAKDKKVYYLINFLDRKVEENFVDFLFSRIFQFAGITLFICWFLALIAARYLTRPLIQMEQHVKLLANKDRNVPLNISNKDEFGQLAESIEIMRQQLVIQEEAQQALLQNISHELKTPVMVIQGYVQALLDGVYPRTEQARILGTIEKECTHIEQLIKQLLYLTMLDYISSQSRDDRTRIVPLTTFRLDQLIEDTIKRLSGTKPGIQKFTVLEPVSLEGNEDQWRVITENIIDNHLHYARTTVTISLTKDRKQVFFKVHNDGSRIDPQLREQLFQPFRKEKQGKFGLGLTIVQRILALNNGRVDIYNEDDGVTTMITIPAFIID